MPITINSNPLSLNAQRQLAENAGELSKTYEKLSSGLRINRASDDSAGLAIAETLKASRVVYAQGIRNFNDGISLLSVADSAAEDLTNIVARMKELAGQAANGTYSAAQRKALDAEAQALAKEYLRIAQSTKFNGRQLFSTDFGSLALQGGFGANGSIASTLGGAAGTATLGSSTLYDVGDGSQSGEQIKLADVNGDGHLDAIIGVDDGSDGTISVRLGNGSGSFGSELTSLYKQGSAFNTMDLVDTNNDGNYDIVVNSDSNILTYLGRGDGTFQAPLTSANGASTTGQSLGDINGDGFIDIVTVTTGSSNALVHFGAGNGTFGAAVTYSMDVTSSRDVELADVNGDGILDLVSGGTSGATGTATIRLGSGGGTFGSAISYVMDTGTTRVTTADINNDGKLDIATSAGANTVYRLGAGDGTFGSAVTIAAGSDMLVDFNGDGNVDLLGGDILNNDLYIYLGDGRGNFTASGTYIMDFDGIEDIAIGDTNGDGVYDIVTTGYSSTIGDATIATRLQNTAAGIGALLGFSLQTAAGARQALSLFSNRLDRLSLQRGTIGAFQSRLNVATSVLSVTAENYAAAESRIRDVDVAEETSKLVARQVRQQAAVAILAQANQQPSLVLGLLSQE